MESKDVQKAKLFDLVNLDDAPTSSKSVIGNENGTEETKPTKMISTSKKFAEVQSIVFSPYNEKTSWRRRFTLKLTIILVSLLLVGFTTALVLLKVYERTLLAELSLTAPPIHDGPGGKGDWGMEVLDDTELSSDLDYSSTYSSYDSEYEDIIAKLDKRMNTTDIDDWSGLDIELRAAYSHLIRLVDGGNEYEGRVEIKRQGTWGTICHNQWDIKDGQVACRQLGYGPPVRTWKSAHFGPGNGQIWLKKLRCDGSEERLQDCRRSGWGKVGGCTHEKDASVRCEPQSSVSPCDSNPCFNGGSCTNDNDAFQCTCRSGWIGAQCNVDKDDCNINPCQNSGTCIDQLNSYFCNCQGGYSGTHCEIDPTNHCDGVSCENDGTCTSNADGFVCTCQSGYTGLNCETEMLQPVVTVRLVGGTEYAGIVQVWRNNIWGTICDDFWDIREAFVVCRQLGFSSAVVAYNWNDQYQSSFDHVDGQIWLDDLRCIGTESRIESCIHGGWGVNNCVHNYPFSEQAGVMCSNPNIIPSNDLLNTGICGTRPVVDRRIVSGVNADVGEWPWMASLRDTDNYHRCGAVLISSKWAITAAHCSSVVNSIVLGDIRTDISSATHHESVVELFIHPQYNPVNVDNDIALLKLNNPVPDEKFDGGYIRPACLAVSSSETTMYPDGACKATGWGDTEYRDDDYPPVHLQEVDLALISKSQCLDTYYHITDNMICTDVPIYAGTCQGDSGGPLQCSVDGVWHLVGATSHGRGCGGIGVPDVFARVSRYTQFIKQTVDMHGGP